MNFVDKLIESVSPEAGLKRQYARKKLEILNSGYSESGASKTKKSMFGWRPKSGSAEDDIVNNLDTLRQRSRSLYMGSPLACGGIKTMRTNIIGSGLKLKSKVDEEVLGWSAEKAREFERKAEKEFALWADSKECDAIRKNNFVEIQQLIVLNWLMSGDSFVLLPSFKRNNVPYDLRLRVIEADRVCDPKPTEAKVDISGGVETNENGEIVAYHVAQWHPGSDSLRQAVQKNKNKWVRIPAYGDKTGRINVLHLMNDERSEQRRGVPFLAPVIESLKQLQRYSEAELMAAVVSGMFTVFIKSDSPQTPLGEMISTDNQLETKEDNDYELGNGAIIGLGENESVDSANPGRPNTAFEGFVTAICREIGAGLELPYELLIKNFTASYSASRAALLEAWKVFRMWRAWMVADFCQPVYEEFMCEAVAKGRLQAPGFFNDPLIRKAYCGSEWHGPSQGQLDPRKEVEAAKIRVEEGFSTRARETQELTGGDWESYHKQRVKEETMRRDDNVILENNNGSSYVEVNTEQ